MDKNVRRNPFGGSGQNNVQENPKIENQEVINQPRPFIKPNNPPKMNEQVSKEVNQPKFGGNNFQNNQQNNLSNQNNSSNNDEMAMKEFDSIKNFNCSKNFIRTTSDKLPANSSLLKESSFPIGLILNPFAHYEAELPTVNYGDSEIPRCYSSQCRAYINPFVKWIEGGDKWICNICKNINNTESYYYGKLDKYSNRADINEKPDLAFGSYEFVANKTYMKKDKLLNQPTFIFIIDVSLVSSQNGFLSAVIESIKDTINSDAMTYWEKTKVAFITYDSSVHFYCLSKKLTQPQMLCVSDDNIFLPSTIDSLLVELGTSKKMALTALDLIQNSFTTNTCKDSNKLFTAINAGHLLAKNSGAKLVIFNNSNSMTTLPKMRSPNLTNIPKDELIYTPTDEKQLSTLGINMTNENVSVDLFIASENYVNLITLNQLCDYTNGNMYLYKNFRLDAHYKNIFNQIRRCMTRFTSLEAVVRTRFSRGYKIGSFVTPVLISNNDLLICPTLDSDQTYTVGLDVVDQDGPNSQGQSLQLQVTDPFTAVLYTHPEGTRRIRIHNYCVPVANRLIDIYNSIDVETLATFYMKLTVDKILKTKKISNSVLSTESAYKALISSVMSTQQSLKKELPENLMYLPLYILGILKHRICCKDELEKKYDVDLSNYLRIKIQRLSYLDVLAFLYPRIYAIHNIMFDEYIGNYDENGVVVLPQLTSTYFNSLENDGVYLIDNGYILILYSKFNADSRLLRSLFNVEDLSQVNLPLFEDTVFNDPDEIKQRVINIVDYIRGTKALFQNLVFIFEGTDGERIIKESLVEDNFCPWMSVDFKTFYTNTVESGSSGYRPGLR